LLIDQGLRAQLRLRLVTNTEVTKNAPMTMIGNSATA